MLITHGTSAQDSIHYATYVFRDSMIENTNNNGYNLSFKHLIVPTLCIGYGVLSLESDGLKQLNFSTKDEKDEHQPRQITLDNYTQYVPVVMVYGLNAAGIKGSHNFRDRTIIYATSQLISAAFVIPLKHIVKEKRPDNSNSFSFPSGHTATAFSSAQFMFREYKDTNFLLSISGYSFAVFTGVYRAVNDKHWVSDIVAGAGFGILSTNLAYWLYPKINELLKDKEMKTTTMVLPFYQNRSFGLGLVKII
jgi:membrane-associated phospholipid phosphatase